MVRGRVGVAGWRWMLLLVLVAGAAGGRAARAQAAVYAEFTASQLSNGPQGDFLYGGTAGLVFGVRHFGRHVFLEGDLQGRFVGKNGERLDGAGLGPRLSVPLHFLGLTPYAEGIIGFARYNDGSNNATTDETIQGNFGVTRRVTPHFDATLEYSYAQYGALNGFYSPQSYSAGVMYHFGAR